MANKHTSRLTVSVCVLFIKCLFNSQMSRVNAICTNSWRNLIVEYIYIKWISIASTNCSPFGSIYKQRVRVCECVCVFSYSFNTASITHRQHSIFKLVKCINATQCHTPTEHTVSSMRKNDRLKADIVIDGENILRTIARFSLIPFCVSTMFASFINHRHVHSFLFLFCKWLYYTAHTDIYACINCVDCW